MNLFDIAMEKIFESEGNYVFHPNDPGGETKYGISKRFYPKVNIYELTKEQAKVIYKRDFWYPLGLDEIDEPRIMFEIFDASINCGIKRAILIVQKSLNLLGENLRLDAKLGRITLMLINKWGKKDPVAFLRVLNGFQFMWYYNIIKYHPEFRKFVRGWMQRIQIERG